VRHSLVRPSASPVDDRAPRKSFFRLDPAAVAVVSALPDEHGRRRACSVGRPTLNLQAFLLISGPANRSRQMERKMADAKSPAGPATSRIPGLGLLGRKVGMTRIFNDDGESVAVTVLEVSDNRVTQIKTAETDGYAAVQLAHGVRKPSRIRKPQAGHFAKAGVQGGSALREFRLKETEKAAAALGELKVGITLGVDQFEVGQKVDVTGVTI